MSPHLHEHEFVQMGLIYFFYLALATLAAQPLGHKSNRGMGQAAPNQATAIYYSVASACYLQKVFCHIHF